MLGIEDAAHAEYDPNAPSPLIAPVSCPVAGRPDGAPKLSGKLTIRLDPDSLAFRIYRQEHIEEEFFCNYELNPAFQAAIEAGRLRLVGLGERGEARVAELPGHPFFLAALFLPQLSSSESAPHPLIMAYLETVLSFREAFQPT